LKPENCSDPNERDLPKRIFLARTASAVAKGYGRLFKSLLLLAAAGICILTAGILIVYPLWFLAGTYKGTYALLALCSIFLIAVLLVIRRIRRNVAASGGPRNYLAKRLAPFLLRVVGAALGAGFLYAGILLFIHGKFAGGILSSLVFLAALGAVLFSRHDPA